MKHHEYQVYIGGWKHKLKGVKFCYECNAMVVPDKIGDRLNNSKPKSKHGS